MKYILLLFSLLLFPMTFVQGQDILYFFRKLQMPYSWGLTPEVKEILIKNGKLDDPFSVLNMDILDKKKGFLRVSNDCQTLEMCYWSVKDEYKTYHLIALCRNACDSNGCCTESLDFYIYENNQFLSDFCVHDRLFSLHTNDFFKEGTTKEQIENAGVCLVYKLPQQGKDLLAYCYILEGEDSASRIKKARSLLKGNIIKLTFDENFGSFSKGEPYYGPCYDCE